MLTSTCAIFPCRDMDRTVQFYRSIGFALQGRWDNFGGYLIFEKDKIEMHFAHDPNHVAERSDHAAYIRTDDVNGWSDEIEALGISSEGIPRFAPAADRDWDMREMHLIDPDGHLLRVGQHLG